MVFSNTLIKIKCCGNELVLGIQRNQLIRIYVFNTKIYFYWIHTNYYNINNNNLSEQYYKFTIKNIMLYI